jgi:hypothetical protein
VEEIERELVNAIPQVFRTVVYHGDELDMLEEEVASVEVKALRANLAVMMHRIKVS